MPRSVRLVPVLVVLLGPTRLDAAPVAVRAVDASGAPVAGARLEVASDPPVVATPGDDATLAADVPDGALACVVAPGFVPRAVAPTDTALTLVRAGSAAGVVVDAATGAPVPGLRVATETPEPCAPVATTDAKGAWRLDGLAPGTRRLVVDGGTTHLASPPLPVRVTAGAAARADVRLHPSFALTLALADGAGAPAAGAEARVVAHWERRAFVPDLSDAQRRAIDTARVVSDAKGAANLPPLPRDAAWRVALKDPRFAPRSVVVDGRRAAATESVTLRPGGSLALPLVDEEELPVAGATGRFVAATHPDLDLLEALAPSGSDGVLRATRLPPGTHALEVRAPGFRPRIVRGLVIAEGKALAAPRLVLDPGASLAVLVVDAEGPVSGADITLRTWSEAGRVSLDATSDATGQARFEGLDPEARCALLVSADGHADEELDHVAPGGEPVRVTLVRAGGAEITLVDAETGDPVRGELVALQLPGSQELEECEEAEGVAGRYDCDGLAEGQWLVMANASGFLASRGEAVEIAAGSEPARRTIRMSRGGRITGLVVDAESDAPLSFATVRGSSSEATTGADGRFVLEGVEETTTLTVRHPTRVTAKRTGVEAGSDVRIELESGGAVEGDVLGPDGEGQAAAVVRVDGADGGEAMSDAAGHYRLDGLAPGLVRLVKTDDGAAANLEEAVARVVKGQVTRIDFGASRRMTGLVRWRGEPVAGARLTAMPSQGDLSHSGGLRGYAQAAATSDSDGRYALQGVSAGAWAVTVVFQDRRFGLDVTIPDGEGAFERDIDVPDLHVAGRVVDGQGRAVAGAWVSAQPVFDPPRPMMTTVTQSGRDPDSRLTFSTFPESEDVSGTDGSFRLDVASPGRMRVSASLDDDRQSEPLEIDLVASRDDVVLEIPSGEAGEIAVAVRDEATGRPVEASIMRVQGGSTSMTGGVSDWSFRQETGETSFVLAAADSRAADWREAVESDAGGPVLIELRLGRGGDLRLLTAPDALEASPHGGFTGGLHVLLESGFDLASNVNVLREAIGRNAEKLGPGEWMLRHVPAGTYRIGLGTGEPRPIEIRNGDVAELDLR